MIELRKISKKFVINHRANIEIQALDNISLVFDNSGITTILGKSGSGKTTLLNIIGGLDKPTSGSVFYEETDINAISSSKIDDYRNNFIAYVFQDYNLLHEYSVIDNIKFALRLQYTDEKLINQKSIKALSDVGLEGSANRKISTLSGGQQQRVVIARAIAKDSKVLLCDEPTGNLDSKTANEIMTLFKRISDERLVILITHDQDIANRYSDRIINLVDGNVESDVVLNRVKVNVNTKFLEKRDYKGFTIKDSLKMIFDNFYHSIIFSMTLLLMLTSALILTIAFSSLSTYDSQQAYAETLKANDQYVIQITKFVDRPFIVPINGVDTIQNGPQIYYEGVIFEDIEELKTIVGDHANLYPSYFFNKNFQDFTTKFIATNRTDFLYDQIAFREAIAVEDFSSFHMNILYGTVPNDSQDVLLYDYMIYSLIQNGILNGTIESSVGTVLTDQHTGLQMRISGVIKSDYERYNYIKYSNVGHPFEETYLTSLQSIFCKPEFIINLQQELKTFSVFKTILVYNNNSQLELKETDIKKIEFTDELSYNFLKTNSQYTGNEGVIISKTELQRYLGIDYDEIDDSLLDIVLSDYFISINHSVYDWGIERTYYSTYSYPIIGVVDDALIQDQTILVYNPELEHFILKNSTFRQIYLSLGVNWTVNKQILDMFTYNKQSDEFYQENPDFYLEGYIDYNAYGILIQNSNYYLLSVRDISRDLTLLLVISTSIGVVAFAFYTIKKYNYKIGILKALGTRNKDIVTIFGLQIIIIGFIAFMLALPSSYIVMNRINHDFVKDIHSGLIFFSINSFSVLIIFISLIGLLIFFSLLPMIKLFARSPVTVIRQNRN